MHPSDNATATLLHKESGVPPSSSMLRWKVFCLCIVVGCTCLNFVPIQRVHYRSVLLGEEGTASTKLPTTRNNVTLDDFDSSHGIVLPTNYTQTLMEGIPPPLPPPASSEDKMQKELQQEQEQISTDDGKINSNGTTTTTTTIKTPQLLDDNNNTVTTTVVQYLLNVPFYIYPGWGIISHPNVTLKLRKKVFDITTLDPEGIPIHSINERKTKHADDYYLAISAQNHPMRVLDPSKAKLFLIPTPMNLLLERNFRPTKKPLCLEDEEHEKETNSNNNFKICNGNVLSQVNHELGQSQWFQRHQGKDHIVVASHWMYIQYWKLIKEQNLSNLFACNTIDFEGKLVSKTKRTDRISFPSYYVGKPCPPIPIEEKTQDFAMIATLIRTDHNVTFKDRTNICNWIQNYKKNNNNNNNNGSYKMKVCGLGEQCPTLSEAKFGFHAVGDTPGSNRLMDLLLSHTIPIFTRKKQYDVLPTWIDWDQISYLAQARNSTLFLSAIEEIMNDDSTYQEKQQNVIHNSDLFNYDTIVPFDTYMYMFQVAIYPETKRTNIKSQYSALILP